MKVTDLQLSPKGLAFIMQWESFSATPYNDQGNNATVGYGHLLHLGPVTQGDWASPGVISQHHATQLLLQDVQQTVEAIGVIVPNVDLKQSQFDALVSFVFNIGNDNFESSSARIDLIIAQALQTQAEDSAVITANQALAKLPADMALWVDVNHAPSSGLIRRRKAEGLLWKRGNYSLT